MSNNRLPTNGSGSVFNNNNNTRQHLYPGAFRNYPWGRTYLDQNKPLVSGVGRGEPEAPSLSLGERVVWLKDSGPEIGTARWIGRMPLVSPDWSVGVEFDRPIGTGDGKFGTKQYFQTRPNHAFFLPVMALMKAEEYNVDIYGGRVPTPEDKNFLSPSRSKSTWEKSRVSEENLQAKNFHHHQHHCCNCHEQNMPATASSNPRCFVTSTPRNATRHKSVTIKETVGNVPGFAEWSDEDELSKFPFKSWKSSSRQSVVSCPASVGPPTILIAKELTSDSSDTDERSGKFKTLMACFVPGLAHRDKKKKKRKKYILASEKNKVSFVTGQRDCQPDEKTVLGAVSGGGDLWRNPHCEVRSVTGSCSSFPTHHCVSCQPKTIVAPPRKNFSCSGLEKLNACPTTNATTITPLRKKTPAPAPPTTLNHGPVSPKFSEQSNLTKNNVEVKSQNNVKATSVTNVNSATKTPRMPVIRSLDAARNEIDISMIATKYTFVGNSGTARSNSFSGTAVKKDDKPKELKPLNDPLTISPHPRRIPKKKAPQPPTDTKTDITEAKAESPTKKRSAPLPPALPKKTTTHDTMTLFGYEPREGNLSRTSSGATLEMNLDKSMQSEASSNDLLTMAVDRQIKPESPVEIKTFSSIEVNIGSSVKPKNDEDAKSLKILNTEASNEEIKKPEEVHINKENETKPTMRSSSSQTNLSKEDEKIVKTKKTKRKLLGGKKNKKEETKADEVTEILTEIEQVVKSKPTVQDFVTAFTKFTEKAEQIAKTQTPPQTKPEPKPVKISPPKPKLVPIPVVTPIILKEDKKSLKSFPTKWTFNFKNKMKKNQESEGSSLTRNESSPSLESRSESVRTITPQSSMPLSRKTYALGLNDFKENQPELDRFVAKDEPLNSNGPFIQNREALRRLSKENRHRHGSTLSLGRFVGDRAQVGDASYNRKSQTPNPSPILSRHKMTVCSGKPPLPVKVIHDTMVEQNSNSANLFSQLEAAIANGQHQKAAVLARELALQKVTGSLGRLKKKENKEDDKNTTVSLYVEDKNSHKGPINLSIYPKMTVAALKQKVEDEFNFKRECQRWILGKTFVVNDDSTMEQLDVCTPGCPIFLYIVAPSNEKKKSDQATANNEAQIAASGATIESFEALTEIVNRMAAVTRNMLLAEEIKKSQNTAEEPLETLQEETLDVVGVATETLSDESEEILNDDVESDVSDEEVEEVNASDDESDDNNEIFEDAKQLNYQELMQLEEKDLITNVEVFECPICFIEIETGEGTILRDCLHNFCRECLSKAVEYSEDAVIKCPFRNDEYSCDSHLLEREIKALVTPELFEKHLQRSMVAAESKAENSFHCKSPDCPGWCLYEDNVNVFRCPVCDLENCLTCQAIHEGKDCKQYQDEIEYDADASEDAKKTKEYLDNMVKEGQAMHCPTCRVIVMKKWGCDWLKCSVCQSEICWVTKGPRWGPGGRGDTSAGCKCGVNGVRCHTLCNYCH